MAAEQGLRQTVQSLEQELRALRQQLLGAQQDMMRCQMQTETIQALLDRLGASPALSAASTKPARKKAA